MPPRLPPPLRRYENTLRGIMQRYAGRDACEGEVLAGHVLAFSRFYRTSKEKTDTARENMSASLCALRAQLRRTFWEKIGGSDPLLPLSPSKRAEYLLAARDRMDASLDRSRSLGTPQGVATGPEGLVAAEGPAAAPPTPTPSGASPPPDPLLLARAAAKVTAWLRATYEPVEGRSHALSFPFALFEVVGAIVRNKSLPAAAAATTP